jgi:hypothetical protein
MAANWKIREHPSHSTILAHYVSHLPQPPPFSLSLPLTCKNSTESVKGQLNEKVSTSPSIEEEKLISIGNFSLVQQLWKSFALKVHSITWFTHVNAWVVGFRIFRSCLANGRAFPLKHVLSSAPLKPALNPKLSTRVWAQKNPWCV